MVNYQLLMIDPGSKSFSRNIGFGLLFAGLLVYLIIWSIRYLRRTILLHQTGIVTQGSVLQTDAFDDQPSKGVFFRQDEFWVSFTTLEGTHFKVKDAMWLDHGTLKPYDSITVLYSSHNPYKFRTGKPDFASWYIVSIGVACLSSAILIIFLAALL